MKLTLVQWRKIKNITQRQLAANMGVHENTIRNWEEHPERLTLEKAEKVSKALGVPQKNIIFCAFPQQNVEAR